MEAARLVCIHFHWQSHISETKAECELVKQSFPGTASITRMCMPVQGFLPTRYFPHDEN